MISNEFSTFQGSAYMFFFKFTNYAQIRVLFYFFRFLFIYYFGLCFKKRKITSTEKNILYICIIIHTILRYFSKYFSLLSVIVDHVVKPLLSLNNWYATAVCKCETFVRNIYKITKYIKHRIFLEKCCTCFIMVHAMQFIK